MLNRKSDDLISVALGEVDIVPSIQKLVAADRIDFKGISSIAANNGSSVQIDRDRPLRIGRHRRCHIGDIGIGNDGRHQSVLDRILCEDIAERRRDDAAKSIIVESIDRRFA